MHGGTVSAHSGGPGTGSEFVIRLPMPADTARVGGDGPAPKELSGFADARDGIRVLVVDDNEDAADMLVAALSAKGYGVRKAHDGPAAIRVCGEFKPQVALLDIGLPVMDGYELAARLQELPGVNGLRLCAVTGYGQESDRARSRAAGFHQHLVKPIDFDVLERIVRELSTGP